MNAVDKTVEFWDSALVVEPMVTLAQSVVFEYSQYFKCSMEEAAIRLNEDCNDDLLASWTEHVKQKPSLGAQACFGSGGEYIVPTLQACRDRFMVAERIHALSYIKRNNAKVVMDYGGGAGNTVILYTRNSDAECWLGEVSDSLLEFAAWRAEIRGLKMRSVNLLHDTPPVDSFDFISCFAVLAQVPKPLDVVSNAYKALRLGGCFFIVTGVLSGNEDRPWNVIMMPTFLFLMRVLFGFRLIEWRYYDGHILAVYRKTARTWYRFVYLAPDSVRFLFYSMLRIRHVFKKRKQRNRSMH